MRLADVASRFPGQSIARIVFVEGEVDEVREVYFGDDGFFFDRTLINQEDATSPAAHPGDVVVEIARITQTLAQNGTFRDQARAELLRVFNEHVDLNRRAIHPDVEAVLIPDIGAYSDTAPGPVVGYVQAGRMFSLAGDPLTPGHKVYTGIAVDRPKRMMVDGPQA